MVAPHPGATPQRRPPRGPAPPRSRGATRERGPEGSARRLRPRAAAGDARADILQRIRAALGDAAQPDVPRNYRTEDERPRDEIVTLFAERVAEYRATVHRVGARPTGRGARERADSMAHRDEAGARRIGIPADLPEEWRPRAARRAAPADGGLELVEDDGLSVQELDALDGALTGCAVAIAETGTFVLDGGAGQGRRALTLVPDLHICVVREDQVVGLVPEAVERARGGGAGRASAHVRRRARPPPRTSSWIASRACTGRACSTWCSWPDADRLPRHLRLRRHGARPAGRQPAPAGARGHPSGRAARPRPQAGRRRRWRRPRELLGIEVFQPEDVNGEEARARIAAARARGDRDLRLRRAHQGAAPVRARDAERAPVAAAALARRRAGRARHRGGRRGDRRVDHASDRRARRRPGRRPARRGDPPRRRLRHAWRRGSRRSAASCSWRRSTSSPPSATSPTPA